MSAGTVFEPALDITLVAPHPRNPRHDAHADAELVASIRTQGVLQAITVVPDPDNPGRYLALMGHRRRLGCLAAKRSEIPAFIRTDLTTEGQQVEAMLAENGRREDLSPIEEAEGYQQLTLLDYKPPAIAKGVGVDPKTVKSRLKLLSLPAKARNRIHEGQLTIEHGLAIVELRDDPTLVEDLDKAIANGGNVAYAIESARRRKATVTRLEDEAQAYRDRGIPEYVLPEGVEHLMYNDQPNAAALLFQTPYRDPEDHDGCLAFYTWSVQAQVVEVCTDPARHRPAATRPDVAPPAPGSTAPPDGPREISDDGDYRAQDHGPSAAAQEKRMADYLARREAEEVSRTLRARTVLDAVAGVKLDKTLRQVLEAVAPAIITAGEVPWRFYFDGAGVAVDDRWELNGYELDEQEATAGHLLAPATDAQLLGALVGGLVDMAEAIADTRTVGRDDEAWRAAARCYFIGLGKLGHEFTDLDRTLEDAATEGDLLAEGGDGGE